MSNGKPRGKGRGPRIIDDPQGSHIAHTARNLNVPSRWGHMSRTHGLGVDHLTLRAKQVLAGTRKT